MLFDPLRQSVADARVIVDKEEPGRARRHRGGRCA
jgi:hypothetical protein